jgi:hypothetical protein
MWFLRTTGLFEQLAFIRISLAQNYITTYATGDFFFSYFLEMKDLSCISLSIRIPQLKS